MTVTNSLNLTTTSSVSVTVNQTLTKIIISPSTASLYVGATQQFTATGYDQFGAALTAQPAFKWSASAGLITSAGLFSAPASATTSAVTAGSGTVTGTTSVNVLPLPTVNAAYLLPDPLAPSKTVPLHLWHRAATDTIVVNPATGPGVPAGSVTVLFNGAFKGTFDPTSRIIIHGVAGNETIGVSPQVTTPSFIYGGQGNRLRSGAAAARL